MNNSANWICCQLGAREHYAIPCALHQSARLAYFITDAWVKPDSFIRKFPINSFKSLGDRYHPDLNNAPVKTFTSSLIQFEIQQRLRKTADWDRMITRNQWFQDQVIKTLEKITIPKDYPTPILFTYSYAALEILRYAKKRGWQTILGQIDPGIKEEDIVKIEQQKYFHLAPNWQPVPPSYWNNWRQECELADQIMVNSSWSKKLLEAADIGSSKIKVIPLVYEAPKAAENFIRIYPEKFTNERPLKVLFLGLINLRKGIAACLEAIKKLTGEPIQFWFVGSIYIDVPEEFRNHPQIKWIGSVPRSETYRYYQDADIFIFPTLSDGFGLTQLEAQAWKLPIVASHYCGQVIVDNFTGWILRDVNGNEINNIIKLALENPGLLSFMSSNIKLSINNNSENLYCSLQSIF